MMKVVLFVITISVAFSLRMNAEMVINNIITNNDNYSSNATGAGTTYVKNHEARLIENLLYSYQARGSGLARPVADSRTRLTVTIKFIIHEYEGINDVTKRMQLAGMLKATWEDIYLSWDPKEYGGLEVIPLRGDNIYLPVIVRQSSAAEMTPIFAREGGLSTLIWVDYKGNVYATVAGVFRTDCQLDLLPFPFDNQTCEFVFQVWQHSENQLALKLDPVEPLSLNVKSSGAQAMWVIDSLAAAETLATLDIANFSAIVYTIKTSRRSVYYIWNLLVPCAMLSTVQLAAFFMPYGPERVMFAITLVLSLHLFQDSVTRQLPATAEPIPIVKYSGSQMMIGILVTIESVLMIYALEVLGKRQIPKWLSSFRNVFYTRSRLLLFRRGGDAEANNNHTENEAAKIGGISDAKVDDPLMTGKLAASRLTSRRTSQLGVEKMTVEEKEERKDEWRDTILMFDRMIFVGCLAATIGIPASVY